MAIRVEWIAIAMIIIMLSVSFLFEAKHRQAKNSTFKKEFEVYNSVTIEVDQSGIKNKLFSEYGMKESGILTLTTMTYIGNSVEKLQSDKGRFIDNKIYLDYNVTALQNNGYYYTSDHAIYNQLTQVLYLTSPFVGYVNNSIIKGTNLEYAREEKVVKAKRVNATFYPQK